MPGWREFEKLVARIEQAIAPSHAIVRSPERIPDKLTGELREVDATVRLKVGTSEVLITIECRDRSATEDVRWIEQLAQKQRDIGAAVTVAVSSTGFSGPALTKASILGIQTRTLTEATAADFVKWLRFQNVVLDIREWSLADLALELYDSTIETDLLPEFNDCFRQLGHLAPIFIRRNDGKRFHVENILIEWTKRNGSFFPKEIPINSTTLTRTLHQPLSRGYFYIETTTGDLDVSVIHIKLSFSRTRTQVPQSGLFEYADSSSPLIQSAEWNLPEELRLSLHRDLSTGETKVWLTDKP